MGLSPRAGRRSEAAASRRVVALYSSPARCGKCAMFPLAHQGRVSLAPLREVNKMLLHAGVLFDSSRCLMAIHGAVSF